MDNIPNRKDAIEAVSSIPTFDGETLFNQFSDKIAKSHHEDPKTKSNLERIAYAKNPSNFPYGKTIELANFDSRRKINFLMPIAITFSKGPKYEIDCEKKYKLDRGLSVGKRIAIMGAGIIVATIIALGAGGYLAPENSKNITASTSDGLTEQQQEEKAILDELSRQEYERMVSPTEKNSGRSF